MRQIVGLIGLKGAGKDTAASYLVNEGFRRVAFADALYAEVAATFNVTVQMLGHRETKETPQAVYAFERCRDARFVTVVRKLLPDGTFAEFLKAPHSPRQIMQWWGTEYRRKVDKDSYWLDIVRGEIESNPTQSFVITDVRFPNEAEMVKELEGVTARVTRPVLEARAAEERLRNGTFAHDSETALLEWPTDFEFTNEEGEPEKLEDSVLAAFTAAEIT